MADPANGEGEEELLDYEEEEVQENEAAAGKAGAEKKGYVGIHATGFKELMLKPELLQAITDCGFEHPSEGVSAGPQGRVLLDMQHFTAPKASSGILERSLLCP